MKHYSCKKGSSLIYMMDVLPYVSLEYSYIDKQRIFLINNIHPETVPRVSQDVVPHSIQSKK